MNPCFAHFLVGDNTIMVWKSEKEDPAAKTIWPRRMSVEKPTSEAAVPYRSTIAPPKNGSAMFGMEYSEYSRFCALEA